MISRTSPSTLAASAALARPGPIAAATSAGVDPSGTSRTEPSGRAILNIFDMGRACSGQAGRPQPSAAIADGLVQNPLFFHNRAARLSDGTWGINGQLDDTARRGALRDSLHRYLARIFADRRDQRRADHRHARHL